MVEEASPLGWKGQLEKLHQVATAMHEASDKADGMMAIVDRLTRGRQSPTTSTDVVMLG